MRRKRLLPESHGFTERELDNMLQLDAYASFTLVKL